MGLEQIRLLKAQALIPKQKRVYSIPKKSAKKIAREKQEKLTGTDNVLDLWFDERRKEMTGRCVLCGGKTEKSNDETFRRSIHHLFEKRKNMFPSVSTHPDNWLEVCFYGNSCHTNLHNGTITWELLLDSKEGKIIVDKFKKVYPFIEPNQRKNIPDCLMRFID